MKKILFGALAVFAAFALFSCDNSSSVNPEPSDEVRTADMNDSGSHVSLTETPPENEEIPADSIRKYIKGTGTNWSVYNIYDLAKLSEIVNGGDSLKGITVTVQNDITVNENLLTENYDAPAEAGPGIAASRFNNLDSIGRFWGNNSKSESEGGLGEDEVEAPFEGTFDGNGKVISGFYAYQGHQGLGFIGYAKNAVIKNLILKDACIVNYNIWCGTKDGTPTHDGYDDDRFGGIVGLVGEGSTVIENCFFSGVIGSKDALDRAIHSSSYSYIGGLAGLIDKGTLNVHNTMVWSRIYSSKELFPITGSTKHNGVLVKDATVKGTIIEDYEDIESSLESDLAKVQVWINTPVHSVTFDADNNSDNVVVKVSDGQTVAAPSPDPVKDGFTFAGWFNGNAETAYDFTAPVTGDITLTAHWEAATQPPVNPEEPEEPAEPENPDNPDNPEEPGEQGGQE